MNGDLKLPLAPVHQGHIAPVLSHPGARVVPPVEGHALGQIAAQIVAVNLRTAAAVRGEQQGLPIGHPARLGVDSVVASKAGEAAAGQIHKIDIRAAVLGQHHGDRTAIRGPRRGAVQTPETGQLLALAGGQNLAEDRRPARFKGHISHLRAIGRPGRRHDGVAGLEQHQRPRAVGVGQGQAEIVLARGIARYRDVDQARGKGPGNSRQLLVNRIRHPVREHPRLGGGHGQIALGDARLAQHVVQLVVHRQALILSAGLGVRAAGLGAWRGAGDRLQRR